MIGTLISIVITLIIVGVIWWAIQQLLPLLPLPEPFRKIIYVCSSSFWSSSSYGSSSRC